MRPAFRPAPLLRSILIITALAAAGAVDCARLSAQDAPPPSVPTARNREARYSIRGNLRDAASNREMNGVKVDLRQLGGASLGTVYTGVSGEFMFNDISPGLYEIGVDEVGYGSVRQQVTVQDSVLNLQVFLRRLTTSRGAALGPTVSVRELTIPRKAHELMQKGLMQLYQNKDYRAAIPLFERAIKEYPTYYEAYAEIGAADMELGDMAGTEVALRKAIDVSGQRYAAAYFALAGLYLNAMRYSEAEPLARKAAELEDGSWQGHYELACALYGLNRDAEAEPEAQAAAQIEPADGETRLVLANVHIHLHKYPEVLEDLDTYLKIDPNAPNVDQAQHLRDQVQQVIEKEKEQAAAQAEAQAAADADAADAAANADSDGAFDDCGDADTNTSDEDRADYP